MQAAYDAIMEMPAVLIKDGNKNYEITIANRIVCFACFSGGKRTYFWDEFCGSPLNDHGVDIRGVISFSKRPEFKNEMDIWVKDAQL